MTMVTMPQPLDKEQRQTGDSGDNATATGQGTAVTMPQPLDKKQRQTGDNGDDSGDHDV